MVAMDNRRANYRHTFPVADRSPVDLALADHPQYASGEIVDLSVEGMKVRLDGGTNWLRTKERVVTKASFHRAGLRLTLDATIAYVERGPFDCYCGIRFL